MSNAVQHQTNRSPACTRTAQSRRRMLYVVAVGTLISTLNQAYKSSEVHVSARMISGGRLLALTSSGIYIGALHLQRSSAPRRAMPYDAMRRAGENRSRSFAQYWHGKPACPSSVRLREYLHKIYYPAVVEKGPFGNYCANTRTALEVYPFRGSHRDWSPLFAAFMRICASRNARRTNEWTNVRRTNRRTEEENKGWKRREGALSPTFHSTASPFRGILREKFLPWVYSLLSPSPVGYYQWHAASNSSERLPTYQSVR